MKLYGLREDHRGKPAWFHRRESAELYARAAGSSIDRIETIESQDVDPDDILDILDSSYSVKREE